MPLNATLVEAAIMKFFNQSKSAFAPRVGDIISTIATATLEAKDRPAPSPEEAWGLVFGQIESRGYYQGPTDLPPAIRRAVDAIGWQRLCTTENLEADRAHFFRVYSAFREKAVQTEIEALTGSESLALRARAILEIEHEKSQQAVAIKEQEA
jgi:hypothetical protein